MTGAALLRRATLASLAVVLLGACGRSPVAFGLGLDGDGGGGGDADERVRCGTQEADFFASTVIGYDPTASGGLPPEREDVVDPEAALGPPDHQPTPPLGTVSIGDGGTLTLGFGRCVLIVDRGPDMVIHEGGFDEQVIVGVRPTPSTLDALGPEFTLDSEGFLEQVMVPDLDGVVDIQLEPTGGLAGPLRFDAVRIRDVTGQGLETVETPGADIDAFELLNVADAD